METLSVYRIENDLFAAVPDDGNWNLAPTITIERYWSGEEAPSSRHAEVRAVWSDTALYVRFHAAQHEPIVASEHPVTDQKTLGLWDRDVCEVFVAPDICQPNRYFEFEAAPTGEWVDLSIEIDDGRRTSDLNFMSGMSTSTQIGNDSITTIIKIPWTAFGQTPNEGDTWLGNLYRCVGSDPTRGYLAWQPTLTDTPSFHAPDRFGEFHFR